MSDRHVLDTDHIVFKKQRPQSARPKRPEKTIEQKLEEDDIPHISTVKLDVAKRITQARILKGYKTRNDLAKALNLNVDIINSIESRKGNYNQQHLHKITQFLNIKTK